VSALTGATLATYDGKAEGGDKVQLEELTRGAEALADALLPRAPSRWARPQVLAPALGGALALGAAALLRQAAAGSYDQLAHPAAPLTEKQIEGLAGAGTFQQTMAAICLGAGALALAAAVAIAAWPAEPAHASVGVALAPGGGGLVVSGAF